MSNHTLLYLPQSFRVALVKRLTNSFVKNMEEDVENPISNETLDETDGGKNGKKSLWKFVKKRILSKFKYLIPFFVLIIYSLIGAGMFIALERDPDLLRRAKKQVAIETARNSTVSVLREIITGVVPDWKNDSYIMEAILTYEQNISFSHSVETEWDFWNAVLYAGTIYTTIGYGNIACKTFGGQLVSIFYAIFGIPLALTTLNDLGKMLLRIIEIMSNVLDNLVRCKFKWARKKRRRNRPISVSAEDGVDQPSAEDQSPDVEKMSLNEWDDARSRDPQADQSEDEERSDPPVLGAVVVTISWLFVCSGIFCIWEDWDYFTSFYFFFVSLSTIGFGDVTPAYPAYMVMNFALVLIGLALVSVCIGVVQQKLQDMYMSLLMTLLKEYQKMLEAGENEMGASLGMAQMWTRNRKAKWLMPFLSKDKRNMVMQKFHEEAKAHNIELPAAFTSVDKKSGLPSIVKAVEKEKVEEWAIKEEKQRAPTPSVAPVEESQLQRQASAPAPRPESCHMTSQTSLNVYAETEQQTYSSSFQLREAMSQTALYELQNRHMQTASSLFQLREATSQTAIRESEARAMQTLASCLSLQQDTSSQTVVKQFHEQPMQTAYSYFQARENESQTLSPIAEHAQSQTNLSYFRSQVGSSQTHSTFTGVKEALSQTALSAFASRHGFAQTDASAFANRHDASQTDLSAFQLRHGYSQTDLLTLRNFDSQTDLSAFQRSDYGNQTDPTASGEAVSQTDVSMVKFYTDDVGSQTNVALLDDRQIQTEYGEQSFATSQTDLSAFGCIDSDSQTTSASVADSALQHGSSLADLTSVALQASYAQNDSMSQTLSSTFQLRAAQSQTTIFETSDDSSQTQTNGPQLSWAQSQTELNVQDNTNQTAISFFKLRNADSQTFYDASDQSLQTDRNETDETECQTFIDTSEESAQAGSEFFRFEQNESQTTLVTTDEIQIQTDSSYFDVAHFGSQTLKNYTDDTHSQTNSSAFDVADQCQQAYVKGDLRDAGVQTGILARVEHLVSRKQGKSKEVEEQSSASYFLTKRKSLKKINNKPAALTLSDDEGQARRKRDKSVSSGESDLNETGNKKDKLEWNPMDGRHVEKQKPVSALLKKFERRSSRQKLTEPSPPPPKSPLGAPKRRPRVDSQ